MICSRCGEDKEETPQNFIFYRTGPRAGRRAMTWCRPCDIRPKVAHKDVSGYVPVRSVSFIFVELIHRLGKTESARAIGMTPDGFREVWKGRTRNVQKRYVRRAIVALRYMREQEFALHRDDITFGVDYRRRLGQPVRRATRARDFYNRDGDNGAMYKRAQRRREAEAA